MAAKDVNLLDDDDADDDAPLDDYGDDLEGSIGGSSSSGKKGGGLIRTIIMALVGLLVLGGIGWGGYQFWWIPKQEKELRDIAMKKRQEVLAKANKEKAKIARAQRKKELAQLQKMQAEAENKVKETAEEKPEAPPEEAEKPEPEKPQVAMAPAPPPAPAMKKKRPVPKAEPAPPPVPEKKMMKPKAAERRKAPAPKLRRLASAGSAMVTKPATAKKRKSLSRAVRRPSGRYFSVQVATCRTDGCVNSFVKKLQAKGYKPFVGGGGRSGPSTLTEVLLGDFSKREDALSLATRARGKKIRASIYRSGGKWFVSAGSYADLEDAAQRLDRVEDSGLSAKLSPRTIASKKSGLRTVRIGRLASRRNALAMQAKITKAGFRGSYVVRRK